MILCSAQLLRAGRQFAVGPWTMPLPTECDFSEESTLVSSFLVGQVVSLGSLIYAPLAQMAPYAIMLLILLLKPTGLYGSPMLKR